MSIRYHKGFSLLELLIAIAITAFLLVAAAPSLSYLLSYGALTGASKNVESAFLLARAEAIRSGRNVTISAVDAVPTARNEYGGGLLVWLDTDGDNAYDVGEELMQTDAFSGIVIDSIGPTNGELEFKSDGRVDESSVASYQVLVCEPGENEGYKIDIRTQSGKVGSTLITTCNY